jgi:hypothetical protein
MLLASASYSDGQQSGQQKPQPEDSKRGESEAGILPLNYSRLPITGKYNAVSCLLASKF